MGSPAEKVYEVLRTKSSIFWIERPSPVYMVDSEGSKWRRVGQGSRRVFPFRYDRLVIRKINDFLYETSQQLEMIDLTEVRIE